MPFILTGNVGSATAATEIVSNSLRFEDSNTPGLVRTPSGAGNRKTFTFSTWMKRSNLSDTIGFFEAFGSSSARSLFYLDTDDFLHFFHVATNQAWTSSAKFRDISAWYNFILAVDTTQSTSTNRVKIYVNGSEIQYSNYDTVSQNADLEVNNTVAHHIGRRGANAKFDGYLAETVLIDGQQLTPTSFGEFDSDSPTIWKPIDVSGLTFGTNGFYLDYEDSSALGNDAGGSNNFTVNNLTAIDQSTDTCVNNFCTWNPLIIRTGRTAVTFSEGNLKAQHNDTGGPTPSWGTFLLNSGKWYWEVKITSAGIIYCGVWQPGYNNGDVSDALDGIVVYRTDGNKQAETAATTTSYGNSFTTGDILGIAVDVDTGTIWFSKNGTWQNSATQSEIEAGTTTNSAYTGKSFATNGIVPSVSAYQHNGNAIVEANFGGGTSFSISSGNADGNGYGNFEYAVPSGYYALNTKNLAEFG